MNVLADTLVQQCGTSDPVEIAEKLDFDIYYHNLIGINGYYLLYKGKKNIVINTNLERHIQKFIIAHEIGHSILHPNSNAFLLSNTLYPTDRQEIEADKFAIHLLLTDDMLSANKDRTVSDWSAILGLPEEIIYLRF